MPTPYFSFPLLILIILPPREGAPLSSLPVRRGVGTSTTGIGIFVLPPHSLFILIIRSPSDHSVIISPPVSPLRPLGQQTAWSAIYSLGLVQFSFRLARFSLSIIILPGRATLFSFYCLPLRYILTPAYVHIMVCLGDDVTVETNDTTKRRAVTADAFADYRNGAIVIGGKNGPRRAGSFGFLARHQPDICMNARVCFKRYSFY